MGQYFAFYSQIPSHNFDQMCYPEIFVHLEASRCPLSDCLFTFPTSENLSGLKKDVLVCFTSFWTDVNVFRLTAPVHDNELTL